MSTGISGPPEGDVCVGAALSKWQTYPIRPVDLILIFVYGPG